MADLWQGLVEAIRLIITLDPELLAAVRLSLLVSGSAVLLAGLAGIPLGALLGLVPFPGSRLLARLFDGLMGLPPVVAGLVLYLLLSRSGPLGALGLLFSPTAMVLAQLVLALPIVTALTRVAVRERDRAIRETAQTLGATRLQTMVTVVWEARRGIMGGVLAGLGRALGEVGAVLMVGGDIAGRTRVMTTAIMLEARVGHFDRAVALGIILLAIAILITAALHRLTGAEEAGR